MTTNTRGQNTLLVDNFYSSNSSVSQLLFPGNSPGNVRVYSSGKTLYVDDTANGNIVLDIKGEIRQNGITAGGDVTGTISSTDNAIVRFDGNTGKIIQNSTATIDDTGNLTTAKITIPTNTDNAIKVGSTGVITHDVNPAYISLGNTYYNGISDYAGFKLRLVDLGNKCYGIGVFTNAMIYQTADPDFSHTFMCGGHTVFATNRQYSVLQGPLLVPGIGSNIGDFSIGSATSNITFNSKNLTNVAEVTSTKAMITTNSGVVMQIGNTTETGSNDVGSISMGATFYSATGKNKYDRAGMQLKIYDKGTAAYGIGVGVKDTLGYMAYCTPGTEPHEFFIGSTPALSLSSTVESKFINNSGNYGWRFSNGASTQANEANIYLQTINNGFEAINFNGYHYARELQYNTGRRRWRIIHEGRAGINEKFFLESFDGATLRNHWLIDTGTTNATGPNNYVQFPFGLATSTINTTSGDLLLAPAGHININTKNLNNVNGITCRYFTQNCPNQGDGLIVSNGVTGNNNGATNIRIMCIPGVNQGLSAITWNGGWDGRDNAAVRRWEFRLDQRYSTRDWFNFFSSDVANSYQHWNVNPAEGNFVNFGSGLRSTYVQTTSIKATATTGGTIDFNGATLTNYIGSGDSKVSYALTLEAGWTGSAVSLTVITTGKLVTAYFPGAGPTRTGATTTNLQYTFDPAIAASGDVNTINYASLASVLTAIRTIVSGTSITFLHIAGGTFANTNDVVYIPGCMFTWMLA